MVLDDLELQLTADLSDGISQVGNFEQRLSAAADSAAGLVQAADSLTGSITALEGASANAASELAKVATSSTDVGDAADKATTGVEGLGSAAQAAQAQTASWVATNEDIIGLFDQESAAAAGVTDQFNAISTATQGVTEKIDAMAGVSADVKAQLDSFASPLDDLVTKQNEAGDAAEKLAEKEKEVGASGDEAAAGASSIDNAIDVLTQKLKDNEITVQEFVAGMSALKAATDDAEQGMEGFSAGAAHVIEAQKEAEAEMATAKATVGELKAAFDDGQVSAETLARAEKELEEATRNAGHAAEEAESPFKEFKEVALEMAGIAVTVELLKELVVESFAAADALETTRIRLTNLTGDAEKTNEMLEQLEKLEHDSAMSMETLAGSAVKLQNFLPVGTDVVEVLGRITDAAAQTGGSVQTITQRFDSLVQSGNASARALLTMQLKQDDLKAAMIELGASSENMAQGVQKAFKALDDEGRTAVLTEALKKFDGVAKNIADNTLGGQWNRAVFQFENSLRDMADTMRPLIIDAFPAIEKAVKGVITVIVSLVDFVKVVGDALAILATSIIDTFAGIGKVYADVVTGQYAKAAADAKAGLAQVGSDFSKGWDLIVQHMQQGNATISKLWQDQQDDADKKTKETTEKVVLNFSGLKDKVGEQIQKMVDKATDIIAKLPDSFDEYIAKLGDGGQKATASLSAITKEIDTLQTEMDKFPDRANMIQPVIDQLKEARDTVKEWADNDALVKIGKDIDDMTAKFPKMKSESMDAFNNMLGELREIPGAIAANEKELEGWIKEIGQTEAAVEKTQAKFDKVWASYSEGAKKAAQDTVQITTTFEEQLGGVARNIETLTGDADTFQRNFNSGMSQAGVMIARHVEAIEGLGIGYNSAQAEAVAYFNELTTGVSQSLTTWAQEEDAFGKVRGAVQALANTDLPKAIQIQQDYIDKLIKTKAPIDDIYKAQENLLNFEIQQAERRGQNAIQYAEQLEMIKIKEEALKQPLDSWYDGFDKVRGLVKQFGDDFANAFDNLITKGGKFKDAVLGALESIGDQITKVLIGAVFKALEDAILHQTNLFTNLANEMKGVLDGIKSIFGGKGAVDAVTAGADAAKAAGDAAKVAGGAADTANAAAGSITKSAGGMVAAAGSIASTVSAVTGVISAITGVIGVFQNMKMESTLNAIESNTRISAIILRDQMWALFNGLWSMDFNYLQFMVKDLDELVEDFRTLMGADPNANNSTFGPMLDALKGIQASMDKLVAVWSGGVSLDTTSDNQQASPLQALNQISNILSTGILDHLDWIMKDLDLIAAALQNGVVVSGATGAAVAATATHTASTAASSTQTAANTAKTADSVTQAATSTEESTAAVQSAADKAANDAAALQRQLDVLGQQEAGVKSQLADAQQIYEAALLKNADDAASARSQMADVLARIDQDKQNMAELQRQWAATEDASIAAQKAGDEAGQAAANELIEKIQAQMDAQQDQLKQDQELAANLQTAAKNQADRDAQAIDVAKQGYDALTAQLDAIKAKEADVVSAMQKNTDTSQAAADQAAANAAALQKELENVQQEAAGIKQQLAEAQQIYEAALLKNADDAASARAQMADVLARIDTEKEDMANLQQEWVTAQNDLQAAVEAGDADAQTAAENLISHIEQQMDFQQDQLKQDQQLAANLQVAAKNQADRDAQAIDVAKQGYDSLTAQLQNVQAKEAEVVNSINENTTATQQNTTSVTDQIAQQQAKLDNIHQAMSLIVTAVGQAQMALVKALQDGDAAAAQQASDTIVELDKQLGDLKLTADNTQATITQLQQVNTNLQTGNTSASTTATNTTKIAQNTTGLADAIKAGGAAATAAQLQAQIATIQTQMGQAFAQGNMVLYGQLAAQLTGLLQQLAALSSSAATTAQQTGVMSGSISMFLSNFQGDLDRWTSTLNDLKTRGGTDAQKQQAQEMIDLLTQQVSDLKAIQADSSTSKEFINRVATQIDYWQGQLKSAQEAGNAAAVTHANDMIAELQKEQTLLDQLGAKVSSTDTTTSKVAQNTGDIANNTEQTASNTTATTTAVQQSGAAVAAATTTAAGTVVAAVGGAMAQVGQAIQQGFSVTADAISQMASSMDFSQLFPQGYTGPTSAPPFAMGSTGLQGEATPIFGGQWLDFQGQLHNVAGISPSVGANGQFSFNVPGVEGTAGLSTTNAADAVAGWIQFLQGEADVYRAQMTDAQNRGDTGLANHIQSQIQGYQDVLIQAQNHQQDLIAYFTSGWDPNNMPHFNEGGVMPYTGMAHLEAGEVVIPEEVFQMLKNPLSMNVRPPSLGSVMGGFGASPVMTFNVVINAMNKPTPQVAREIADHVKTVLPSAAIHSA